MEEAKRGGGVGVVEDFTAPEDVTVEGGGGQRPATEAEHLRPSGSRSGLAMADLAAPRQGTA